MLNINNGFTLIKKDILLRLAKLTLAGELEAKIGSIAREIAPSKGYTPVRCCVYHDRHDIRMRIIACLGISLHEYTEDRFMESYAKEALKREKPTFPMLTVLHDVCNACVHTSFLVTQACQGCLARPCMMNCPRKAINIVSGRAWIDSTKCVNCGLCQQNCPYHAIVKLPVPCEEACPVKAISKMENGKQHIDYERCIFCGNCMRECPFGAMMGKCQLVDVIQRFLAGKKVVALYAPAAATQFRVNREQFESALLKAGFAKVYEVACGADITADKEAEEFENRMARGDKLMTTSCCPAYLRAVKIHVPELIPCVSDTQTPMHYTAEIAKKDDSECITVFIGPCLAKRWEGMNDALVDYVLSIEELEALFKAKDIDPNTIEVRHCERPAASLSGRNFAKSGGVSEAIRVRLKDSSAMRPEVINGLSRTGMAELARFGKIQAGKIPQAPDTPNLVEVMACEGGCIAGPQVICNLRAATAQLSKYAEDL